MNEFSFKLLLMDMKFSNDVQGFEISVYVLRNIKYIDIQIRL